VISTHQNYHQNEMMVDAWRCARMKKPPRSARVSALLVTEGRLWESQKRLKALFLSNVTLEK